MGCGKKKKKSETRMSAMAFGPHPSVRSRDRKRIHRDERLEKTWSEAIDLLRLSSVVYRK